MTTTAQLPSSIQASIHKDAISRVPRFFNATTKDILNELLQNARRSGASRVDITTDGEVTTVSDNGIGMGDPRAILSFGQTGWGDPVSLDERAAGMGLYALARNQKVSIRSKSKGDDGAHWQVDLSPEHFVGKLPAPVQKLEHDSAPGTSVSFISGPTRRGDIAPAAKHYPLPVWLDGVEMERQDFLKDAVHIETWQGIRIGVHKLDYGYRGYAGPGMNFHGITIQNPRLPEIQAVTAEWYTKIDVINSPDLELTLPARKEVIETPFMRELREACARATYTAMGLEPKPVDVPKATQEDAAKMGINLPDAAPILRRWDPGTACNRKTVSRDRWPVSEETMVMELCAATPDEQALAKAANRNHITDRLMKADQGLTGYGWYDRLTRATELKITVFEDDRRWDLARLREKKASLKTLRPDRIVFTMTAVDQDGRTRLIELPSDIAFENDEEDYIEDNRPLVTKDSSMNHEELTELMMDSYFYPNDDPDADSFGTQEAYHEATYEKTAVEVLSTREEALRTKVSNAVDRYIAGEIPNGVTITITVKRGEATSVILQDETPVGSADKAGPTAETKTDGVTENQTGN